MCKVVGVAIGDRTVYVADIKQKYILNIVEAARECELIDQIRLFGSCLDERCNDNSDIDLAIFGNMPEYRALRSKAYDRFTNQLYAFDDRGQAYDLLYFTTGKHYTGKIMQDIENGEMIYARS